LKIKIISCLCFLLCLTTTYAADEIHWTITGENSVTIDWRGKSSENKISYGTLNEAYHNHSKGNIKTYHSYSRSSKRQLWEAKITGLIADTLYYYSIANGPKHTFRTPPILGSSNFKIAAEGDVGSRLSSPEMPKVQALIQKKLPRFALVLGDLAYQKVNTTRIDQHFNDVMAWSQDAAYMPAWGNHDVEPTGKLPSQINEFKKRFDFPNPQVSSGGGEDWYWFDYGNVRFIAYPEPLAGAWSGWRRKADKLMDEAQSIGQIDFIVTFGHRPAYSSGSHGGEAALKSILDDLGRKHSKYALNINGHDHDYERSFPQYGVVHLTVGTGGNGLHRKGSCLWATCEKPNWSEFRAMHLGVAQLHFSKSEIQGSFICGSEDGEKTDLACSPGKVADSFVIRKK
jgi:hypothetical protein